MEGKVFNIMLWIVVVVSVVLAVPGVMKEGAEAAICPTTGQLRGACGQYVIGQNPPVPSPTSACCSLLKSSNPSCLCSALPPSARSIISQKGLNNIKNTCKLGSVSCPGK